MRSSIWGSTGHWPEPGHTLHSVSQQVGTRAGSAPSSWSRAADCASRVDKSWAWHVKRGDAHYRCMAEGHTEGASFQLGWELCNRKDQTFSE